MSTDYTVCIRRTMERHLAQPEATDPMATLAKHVAEARNLDEAHHALHVAAEDEVTTRQWRTVNMLIEERDCDPVDALRLVVDETTRQIVGQGANDTWSGRANDLKRVRFDALRHWVQDASFLLGEG